MGTQVALIRASRHIQAISLHDHSEKRGAATRDFSCGTGGRTKYNRSRRELAKTHWLDTACVGASTPLALHIKGITPLLITANGSGKRQMCGTNKYGFPIRHRQRQKRISGFQTGEIVRAVVPSGKNAGVHTGRVLVRATGSFDMRTKQRRVQGISHRTCTPVAHCDGYSYAKGGCGNSSHA